MQQHGHLNEAKKLYLELIESIPDHPDSLHFLGLIYFQQGIIDKAKQLFEKSIKLNKSPTYLSNYALLTQHQKDYKKTIKLLNNAIKIDKNYAGAWFNLGCVYNEIGEKQLAEDAYLNTIKIDNNNIKALFNLACVQEELNKDDALKITIGKLTSLKPSSSNHFHILGLALSRLKGGQYTNKAIMYFKKAINDNPSSIETYRALASLYMETNSIEKAYELYKKININKLDYRDLSIEYANCLANINEIKEADKIYESILKNEKENVAALTGKAMIHSLMGEFESAELIYRNIIVRDKFNFTAYYGLSQCRKFTENDKEIFDELEGNLDKKSNSLAFYSLGKVYDDLKNYKKAANYYRKANNIRNRRMDFDKTEYKNKIDSIKGIFDSKYIESIATYGSLSELPIFILGAPRSGTTLIEQIISSHPKVYAAGELDYIKQVAHEKYIEPKRRQLYPEKALRLTNVKRDAEIYLDLMNKLPINQKISRITDKMPTNFIYLGYILSMFPKSKIIHLNRHPVDTCLSIYFQNFNSEHKYSFNLDNLIFWYRKYYDLMEYWKSLYGDKILSVNYNDIIDNTKSTAKLIIDYCGLDWDEDCLVHYKSKRIIYTASQWQARQPIYKTSKERWRNYQEYFPELLEGLSDLE